MNHIKTLIAQGRLGEALDQLKSEAPQKQKDNVIQLQNQWSELRETRIKGTQSNDEVRRVHNTIVDSVLSLIEQIGREEFRQENAGKGESSKQHLDEFKDSLKQVLDSQGFNGVPEVLQKIEECPYKYDKPTFANLRQQAIEQFTRMAPGGFLTSLKAFIDFIRVDS